MEVAYELFSYELNMSSADGPEIQLSQVSYSRHALSRMEHYSADNLPVMSREV